MALLLAAFVPPPRVVVKHGVGISLLLLWAGLGLVAAAAAAETQRRLYPGIAFGGLALSAFGLSLWFADVKGRRRRDDDGSDDSGGGGGGPGRPRTPLGPDPGGDTIDWDDFDRRRADWGRAPDEPRVPAAR